MKFLFGLLLLLLIFPVSAQKDIVERYAYAVITQEGSITIHLIDPADLTTSTEWIAVPSLGDAITYTSLSPLGEWILMHVHREDKKVLQLFNLSDMSLIEVIDDVLLPPRPQLYNAHFEALQWSLNDAYIAFHSWDQPTETQGLYLYNIASQTLTKLGRIETNQYEVVFSPDSTRMAFINNDCEGGGCSITLEIYETQTASLIKSIDIGLFGDIGSVGACHLAWSDDNASIAFASNCDASISGRQAEVYVVEMATGLVTAATAMTPTNVEPSRSTYHAEFDFVWRDAQTLFISVHKDEGLITFHDDGTSTYEGIEPTMRTLLYNAQDQSTTIINGNHMGEWTRGRPDLWAYVQYVYSEIPQPGEFYSYAVTKILTFEGFFTELATGPAGCDLQWNREYTVLAYLEATTFCENSTLYFLNAETGLLSTFETSGKPLGWIRLPRTKVETLSTP